MFSSVPDYKTTTFRLNVRKGLLISTGCWLPAVSWIVDWFNNYAGEVPGKKLVYNKIYLQILSTHLEMYGIYKYKCFNIFEKVVLLFPSNCIPELPDFITLENNTYNQHSHHVPITSLNIFKYTIWMDTKRIQAYIHHPWKKNFCWVPTPFIYYIQLLLKNYLKMFKKKPQVLGFFFHMWVIY